MTHVPKQREPWAVACYLAAGFLPALLLRPLSNLSVDVGLPQVLPTLLLVNVAIPVMIVATAVWYPRARTLGAGAPLALLAFTLERNAEGNWRVWQWDPELFARSFHPIVVAAFAASAVLGLFAIAAVSGRRRVGRPDAHERCETCEYSLAGVPGNRCPECGRPH